jgi:diaminopimelate decarboxylase
MAAKNHFIQDYAKAISPILKKLDCHIFFEPGRFLTGNGGILVAKFYKKNGEKFHSIDNR